jgi:hypothetical protein
VAKLVRIPDSGRGFAVGLGHLEQRFSISAEMRACLVEFGLPTRVVDGEPRTRHLHVCGDSPRWTGAARPPFRRKR